MVKPRRVQASQLVLLGEVTKPKRWRGAVRRARSTGKGPSPVPIAWPAVILGVDCAGHSGWSRWALGCYERSGEVDTRETSFVESVIFGAVARARELDVPCVLVLEQAYGGNVRVVLALGRAQERWLKPWSKFAIGNVGKVVKVPIPTWRAVELGPGSVAMKRDEVRPLEQAAALELLASFRQPGGVGPDEAPAILIGHWATHAGELAKLLGKRARETAMRTALEAR